MCQMSQYAVLLGLKYIGFNYFRLKRAIFLNTFAIIMAKKTTNKINKIRLVMIEKEISAKELGEMVKKTTHSINRICRNESQPTLKLLKEIAQALDVNIQELLIPTK